MRLIDADNVKNLISEELEKHFNRWDSTITVAEMETIAKDTIDNAPTVEERPQGKWIIIDKYSDDYKCSVCNSYPLERGDYPELSKFCPACGAKMKIQE